jgi:hypothetical protein
MDAPRVRVFSRVAEPFLRVEIREILPSVEGLKRSP